MRASRWHLCGSGRAQRDGENGLEVTLTMSVKEPNQATIRSLVPARMDRLPWSGFHWLVVVGLGVSWILDGLEIQIASSVSPVLQLHATLGMSAGEAGLIGTVYLAGEVLGALAFGRLTDYLGRKRLFVWTLGLYLLASGISGLAPTVWFLLVFRFIAGTGIGGEYTAINSAIDELIPSYYRGRVDIAINGTYWAGALIGSFGTIFLLNPHLLPVNLGWRIGFFIGPVIGLIIIYIRRYIPESPRWLMVHGRNAEAERIVGKIEADIRTRGGVLEAVSDQSAIEVTGRPAVSYYQITRTMLHQYPQRSLLGFSMMVTQSFLYNAIFFSYALVLAHFYHIAADHIGFFFIPFAIGNLLGPLVLGGLFDTVGRRVMITLTYCGSGVLLAISAALFHAGVLTATTQTVFWCVIFFFASAGASSAYLTVSEIFPLELRGQAISFFFAVSQLVGGVGAPLLFASLVGTGKDPGPLTVGYYVGAAAMFLGGVVAWFFALHAERTSLEDIAQPLSAVTAGHTTPTTHETVHA